MKTYRTTRIQIAEQPLAARVVTHQVREVFAQYRGPRLKSSPIRTPESAVDFIRKVLPDNVREHFVALYLDGASRIAAFSVLATGTATSCPVHPREVFQPAILVGAVSCLVAHNHPSGDLTPSQHDNRVTQVLRDAGRILGIRILDHLIVTDDAFCSVGPEHDQ